MTVREYIGARYVPLYIGEWDNTKAYEPLSIVSYQGNSYTSRQAVPIGIDIENESFWVLSAAYNAQVEQYRQEVQAFDGRITQNSEDIATNKIAIEENSEAIEENKEAIENLVIDKNMKIRGAHIQGSATLVQTPDANILIDVGYIDDAARLDEFLSNYLNDKKLDLIVISHFHDDHAGGVSGVIDYCDSNTKVFYQMETPTTNHDYYISGGYADMKQICDAIFESLNITPIIPTNNGTYEFNETIVKMYNTNIANISVYENSIANNWNIYNNAGGDNYDGSTNRASLNNYSLITRIEYGANAYVDCGDVEGEAQRLNAQYMKKATIQKSPHHLSNLMGYFDFFKNINADYFCSNEPYQNLTDITIDESDIMKSYTYKWIAFVKDCNIYNNTGGEFGFDLINGVVENTIGYIVNKNLKREYSGFTLIPVTQYYENPYYIRLISWTELNTINAQHKGVFYATLSPNATLLANCKLLQDTPTLFGGSSFNSGSSLIAIVAENPNAILRIECGLQTMNVEIRDSNTAYSRVRIYPSFDITNPDINIRRETINNGAIRLLRNNGSGWKEGDSLPNVVGTDDNTEILITRALLGSNSIIVNFNGQAWVTLHRHSGSPHYTNASFDGTAVTTESGKVYLYMVSFSGFTVQTLKKYNMTDGGLVEGTYEIRQVVGNY